MRDFGPANDRIGQERRIRTVCNISALPPRSRRKSGHRFPPLGAITGREQTQQIGRNAGLIR